MRKIAVCLIPLTLVAGCADPKPDPRGVGHDETLLSVSAMGEAETVPDLAVIQIGLETHAASARAASEANARKSDEIAKSLAKFGVAANDMQTSNLSIGRVDWGKFKGQFLASNVLTVRLRDSAKAGDAIAAATDSGANLLSGPNLQISDPEKANRGAYIAAYKAARTRAEAYAEAAGMEISRVLAIRDGGMGGGPPMPYYAAEAVDAAMAVAPPPVSAPGPSIRPGSTRTRVSVQVDFALEEK